MSYAEKIESLIQERDAVRDELVGAVKSRNAAMLLYESARQSRDDLVMQQHEWQEALRTLDSERAANTQLTAQLTASEARAERYRAAIEWIQCQDFDDLRMMLVAEANHDGEYYVCGDSNKPGYGPTLLDAVESAALAEQEGKP